MFPSFLSRTKNSFSYQHTHHCNIVNVHHIICHAEQQHENLIVGVYNIKTGKKGVLLIITKDVTPL